MSIRMRLILALGALLISTIAAIVTALLLDARHRVQNEVVSSMLVTETLLRSSLGSLEGAPDVHFRVAALVASLQKLRHVNITLVSKAPGPSVAQDDDHESAGFGFMEPPEAPIVEVPVVVGGQTQDVIIIKARASDEMGEVWETIGRVSAYALVFAASAFVLTTILINRSLAPVHDLGRALHVLEEGDYNISVSQSGPPEIAKIGLQLNTLAAALRRTRDENRQLSTAIIRAQDDERLDVARELHDELGPHLFSIRATGAALIRSLYQPPTDVNKAVTLARDVQQQIESLQKTNRRVLQQLSPIGLDELGLSRALAAIVSMWRNQQPDCAVELEISGQLDNIERTVALTVYRVAQEGLTNAFRHAGAKKIELHVCRLAGADPEHSDAGMIHVIVRDNGVGLPDETQSGFGLKGLRERVGALGGSFSISAMSSAGTELRAVVPVSSSSQQSDA
ncbi:MAG: histidine kinase [Hyphomicrobium sp.]